MSSTSIRGTTAQVMFRAPGEQVNGLEAVTDGLWLCDQRDNRCYLVDYHGKVLFSFPGPARNASGITFGAGSVWVASNTRPSIIFRHDAQTGQCTAYLVLSGEGGVHGLQWRPYGAAERPPSAEESRPELHPTAPAGRLNAGPGVSGTLWVSRPGAHRIEHLDAETGDLLGSIAFQPPRSHGMFWDERDSSLSVAETNGGHVLRFEPNSGELLDEWRIEGPEVHGLTLDARGGIWIGDASTNQILPGRECMINFGTFLLMQSPSEQSSQEIYSRAIDIAQAAESLGFRNVWLAEHHFSTYGYLSRPAQLATYIAARTTRLRVGTAVIVVPLHHPLIVAEEIATLDLLAGGRVDIGLGRGYQHYEFERLGLELETARARWEESVDIILKALHGEPFCYSGKLFNIPETTIFPRPVQQPHPPIWVTAQSPESVEATVRRGFNLLTGGFGVPIERMAEFRKQFDCLVAEVKPPRVPDVGVQRAVYVTDNVADARAAAEEARWNMRVTLSLRNNYQRVEKGRAIPVPAANEPDTDDLLDRFLVIGTPETVIRQIARLEEQVGINHFNCSFWFGDLEHPRILKSMELFAREVMPAFS